MQFRLSIVSLTISFIIFHHAHATFNLNGWQVTKEDKLTSDVVALAHSHLGRSYNPQSPCIAVTKLEKQVLLGTNLRLQFVLDGKKKCELTAYKPWAFSLLPLIINKCDCKDKPKNEQPVVPDWEVCTEDKTVSEVVGLAQTHVVRTYKVQSPLIKVVQLKKQVLSGTNLRFQFLLNGKKKCELTANKPWLFAQKSIELKSCTCEDQVNEQPPVPDWEVCTEEKLMSEMITVAQSHLTSTYGVLSPLIDVIQLKKQILDGTNLRLQFHFNGKKKCELTAFKPWSFDIKPIEVKNCACEEQESNEESAPVAWEETNEDKLVSEMVGLAHTHLVHTYGVLSPQIRVLKLKKQLVSGTNLQLQFLYDGKKKCKLNAFKPLPQTNKPTEVKDCACEETEELEDSSESGSGEKKEKDKL